jgi:hypothetical protein
LIRLITDPQSLASTWSELRPQIQKALSKGAGDSTTEEYLFQMVLSGMAQAWVVGEVDALLLVSIHEHPNKKTVFVEICAGKDMDSWLPEVEEKLRDYRDIIGADTIEMCGRRGFTKLSNWRVKAYLMELT